MIDIRHGDSREVLKTLADASIDSVVCDPPYALVSVVQRFGNSPRSERTEKTENPYGRTGRGFMGQKWDTGETAFAVEFWAEVMRVLKPGGHVVAFSGTRTYHRLACAIEDAGFEMRDMLQWLYGSGFPKSHDVSKGIDKAEDYRLQAAVRRAAVAAVEAAGLALPNNSRHDWTVGNHAPGDKWWAEFQSWIPGLSDSDRERVEGAIVETVQKSAGWFTQGDIYTIRASATETSAIWEGWGTALKPACEPIVLARKPLAGTVVGNVLVHGTGALNIDGCRVGDEGGTAKAAPVKTTKTVNTFGNGLNGGVVRTIDAGRWPANVVHDGSDEVLSLFPDTASGGYLPEGGMRSHGSTYGAPNARGEQKFTGSDGSAARFFYTAKADATDRLGSKHPTVKPTDLMRWLCRLVTPPGGLVLDPFAGSGSTGVAAVFEGFDAILIEREAEYVDDIRRRIAWAQGDGRLTVLEKKRPPQKEPMEGDLF